MSERTWCVVIERTDTWESGTVVVGPTTEEAATRLAEKVNAGYDQLAASVDYLHPARPLEHIKDELAELLIEPAEVPA